MDNQNYESFGDQPKEKVSSFRLRESEEKASTFRIKEPDGDYGDTTEQDTQDGYTGYSGYSGNGYSSNIPPETIIGMQDGELKRQSSHVSKWSVILMLIVMVMIDLFFVATFLDAKAKTKFIKTHQSEYTECYGTVSNLTCERREKTRRSNGRTRRQVKYVYTFDLSFVFQGKDYTMTNCTKTSSSRSLHEGDQIQIIVRNGAGERSFAGEYDFLYGSLASNTSSTDSNMILIMIVVVTIGMIGTFIRQYGGK